LEAEQEEDRLAVEEQHLKKLGNERERLRNEMQQENKVENCDFYNTLCTVPIFHFTVIYYYVFIHIQQRISQVENENLLKKKQLEEQLKNEKDRYKMDIENLQNQLRDIKQHRSKVKNDETEQERKRVTDDVCKASQVFIRGGSSKVFLGGGAG
jgi:DNA repair exonuclease SbcCD ATPase subunit